MFSFLVTSSRLMKELASEAGVLAPVLAFGAEITPRHLHPGVADAAARKSRR